MNRITILRIPLRIFPEESRVDVATGALASTSLATAVTPVDKALLQKLPLSIMVY